MTQPDRDGLPTLSRVVEVSSLDPKGAEIVIEANESERQAIARRLDIPALGRLKGTFALAPARGGVEIRLRLDAQAERRCVASLEPMTETIAEDIAMQFDRDFDEDDRGEEFAGDTLREPLEGDEIDLGELLVQHLSLSLDPYPRKEGAGPLIERYGADAPSSPFAGLKDLANRDE